MNATSKRRWVLASWVYGGVLIGIAVLAYLHRIPVQLAAIPFYDTLGHFLLIGSAAYLLYRATGRRKLRLLGLMLPLAPVIVGLVAGVEEYFQVLSPYRSASVKDLAADLLGILFFLALDRWLKPDSSPP